MIFQYPVYGSDPPFVLDTDSADVNQVCEWARVSIGAASYKFEHHFAEYANVPDSAGVPGSVLAVTPEIEFAFPDKRTATIDARSLMLHPTELMRGYCLEHGIVPQVKKADGTLVSITVEDLRYVDPDEGKPPLADWQVSGAVIGPPNPAKPGWFMNLYKGHALGSVVTGASGQKYQLAEVGSFMSRFVGWRAV